METVSSRQMDMQKFIADGCKEALLEEKRRFCFLADKHCMFSYQISNFHEKVRLDGELLLGSLDSVPFLACLTDALRFQGQGDALSEAPKLAGKVLRYHKSTRHSDEHDWRAVCHSRATASHWILQRGERYLVKSNSEDLSFPSGRSLLCFTVCAPILIWLSDTGCRFQNTKSVLSHLVVYLAAELASAC